LTEKGNGRITARQSRAWPLEDPAEVGIVHAQTLVVTERRTLDLKTRKTSSETVFHISTEACASRTGNQWARLVRDHWGIESRNHGRRDACLFEDKTRSKNAFIVANFCVARAALLYFNAQTPTGNINAFAEVCRESRRTALGLIMRRRKGK
jgi:predicted transposase YbfD/YdcC